MIGIRQEVAHRIEILLRDLKPRILELWIESALEKSARLHFSSPLPGAIYSRLFGEFLDTLCDSLGEDDLRPAEDFWPELARSGRLSKHTHDEVVHLCTTACRSVGEAIDRATEGAEDDSSVRIALQRILARIRDALTPAEKAAADEAITLQPASEYDALITAAESLRQRLAWSELYGRDVRRSRRLELLRLMLLEIRGLSPAKAAESLLRRLYDELPCRICLLVRFMGGQHGLRLEGSWPGDHLGRELGEEIPLEDEALARLPRGLHGATFAIEHGPGHLEAELVGLGARAMFVVSVPRGKEPAGWLVIGTEGEESLAPDDVEFAETAAVALGTILDNATLSIQLSSAVRRLQDLVRAAPEPILLLDPAGLVLDLSGAAAHVLGVTRSELVRTNLCEKNVLGDRDELKPLLASIDAGRGPVSRLWTGRRSDGTTFRAACSMAALEDGSVVLAFRNVTNVVRAAEVHREAKARYRALLDSAADVVFLLDRQGRCLDVGERALARYGLRREQALQRSPSELFDDVTAAHLLENIRHVLEFATPNSSETTLVARNEELTFQTTLSPVRNAEGEITAVLGIARDVTAARRLEQDLRRVSTLSDSIVRNAPIGIAVLDPAGKLVSANDALAQIVRPGSTAGEIAGLNLITGDSAPLAGVAKQFKEALEGKSFTTPPFKHSVRSGAAEVWLSARCTRFVDEGSGDESVLLLLEDVTDQVRLQKELVETEEIATIGALVTGLAHDLSDRLGPLIGYAQMLQHSKIGIGEMARVNAIERCAQDARRIVESLLAFSKAAAPIARQTDR